MNIPIHSRHAALLSVAAALILCSAECSADMYKCIAANGTQVFSDRPCGPDAQVHNVKPETYSSDNSMSPAEIAALSGQYRPQPNDPVVANVTEVEARRRAVLVHHVVRHDYPVEVKVVHSAPPTGGRGTTSSGTPAHTAVVHSHH